jgi:hypothetical protein
MAMRELPCSSDVMLINQDKENAKDVGGGRTPPKIEN